MTAPVQNIVNQFSDTAVHAALSAGTGYLLARFVMTTLNPATAAVVSAVSAVVSVVIDPIFKAIFAGPQANDASRFLGKVLNISTALALPVGIANSLGYAITVPAFIGLNLVTIGAFVLTGLGIAGAASAGFTLQSAIRV